MMVPMTTLKWSSRSLLESTSTCMETWMMTASMKVSLEYALLHIQLHIPSLHGIQCLPVAPYR